MASIEHCLYCFESLAAHLERRPSMTLEQVEKSWNAYSESDDGDESKKRIPALDRLAADASPRAGTPSSGSSMSLATDTAATSNSSLGDGQAMITESPLFVTWNVVSARNGSTSLRGCIGTFESQELDEGLSSYAITSAIHDTRFHPVSLRELPSLEVAVTLLTDFEDCDDAMDWDLGTHGLRISFSERGRRFGATYLPDVAVEQGWTKEETLVSLMRKAGWMGSRSKWADVDLKVVRYQGKKKELEYSGFKEWKDWVNAQN